MHWQTIFLIIRPLLSAQMLLHLYAVNLKSRILTLEELLDALHRAHDTSAGPDEIYYQLLKHLPDAPLLLLLNI